jgi:hypothetical protein
MEVRVDGSRSTSENWLRASVATDPELPKLTPEERLIAEKLGIAAEEYARSKYAIELTDVELRDKAVIVGEFVQAWLDVHQLPASVESVWLKTFEGKYRLELSFGAKHNLIFVDESLIDQMLEEGSSRAKNGLEHLLQMNLLPAQAARAS